MTGHDDDGVSRTARQVDAMGEAWRRGERPPAEVFLEALPELDDEGAIRLIYEEICLRQEAGLGVDPSSIVRRFPKWKAELGVVFDFQKLMGPATGPSALPETGETLGEFRLLAELGRGGSGRVFLATQASLADRPVVLKVTPGGREEHLSLARLQHGNIVPLYSEQVVPDRGLRVLCMPYLGGATLARVFEAVKGVRPGERTGAQILEAVDTTQGALPVLLPSQGAFRDALARAPYEQAVCWLGACLADGLRYAHGQGLVHMDIKPSNVLLTASGVPMLLDFHLAQGPIGPEGALPGWLGGTPEYVSPEQRAAMTAVREGKPVRVTVDGRSDLYSLGLLLYEALGGRAGEDRPALRKLNPRVSVGLSDVIGRCLEAEPKGRYPDAGALANDLRRHMNHLPLLGVPNRSVGERWRKWRRRRPSALPRRVLLLLLAAGAVGAAGALPLVYRRRVDAIEAALMRGERNRARGQYGEAASALREGLAIAGPTPAVEALTRALDDELLRVRRDVKAAELHKLADLIRFRFGLAPTLPEGALVLVRGGRRVWDDRGLLTRPIGGRREPEFEGNVRNDLLDLVTVWADLRVRMASGGEVAEARREALRWADEAHDLLGPSPALGRLRRELSKALGLGEPAGVDVARPRTAWDHCDLGKARMRAGDYAGASAEFQASLEARPQDFWPNFHQGYCAYRLGQYEEAASAFRVCVALSPETPECYFNRALALEASGKSADALRDYDQALRLDPTLAEAALNRGILHFKAGRLAEASDDLRRAERPTTGAQALGAIRYQRALIGLARGERASAMADLEAAAKAGHGEAGVLLRGLEAGRTH